MGERHAVALSGHVTADNAHEVEERLARACAQHPGETLVLDAADLDYISSAGLRVLMRLLRQGNALELVNAAPEVYDVFDMTGFTTLMPVRRRLRELSLSGLRQIGAGANGRVFRLDEERIVKVYNPLTNPPEKIEREKEVAREAFVHGIPTAISFDMVRVGDGYGIIYEMVDARTLGETIAADPSRLEEYAQRMGRLLRDLHATTFEEGQLPDARLGLHAWADVAERSGCYDAELVSEMRALIDAIPPRNTFVHGDFHPANIMVTDEDELLLIDMGDASAGDPLVDLLGSYQIMQMITRTPGAAERYASMPREMLDQVWDVFIRTYTGMDDEEELRALERRLEVHAMIRSMAGITFSDLIPEGRRMQLVRDISQAFRAGVAALRG